MKLTKDLESKVLEVYHAYAGNNIEFRNRNIQISVYGDCLMIEELCEVYLSDEKDFRQARFSTLLSSTEGEWKVVHQHRSYPDSLAQLRAAQNQLIHAEKMASLGELTAGIAHEIQNPLNFVNNFSDVSNELLEEMTEEIIKGNYRDVQALAQDVKENLTKIHYHGNRADAIVKGMLMHSRSSTTTKEATNINKLTDEYLRLAFHGMRAKDNSFNATLKTDFDEAAGEISIIPQDIGRVILNLITNAFYVVADRRKREQGKYEPTISVGTEKLV